MADGCANLAQRRSGLKAGGVALCALIAAAMAAILFRDRVPDPDSLLKWLAFTFLGVSAAVFALLLQSFLPIFRGLASIRFTLVTVLAGCALSYLLGLSIIVAYPYYVEDGGRTCIPWGDRFFFALFYVSFLQLVVTPVTVAALHWRRRRRAVLKGLPSAPPNPPDGSAAASDSEGREK